MPNLQQTMLLHGQRSEGMSYGIIIEGLPLVTLVGCPKMISRTDLLYVV
jgi:hypothetical protein